MCMKKNLLITFSVVICVVLIGIVTSLDLHIAPNMGVYLSTTNGECLVVVNNTPIVLSAKNENSFADLQNGDKILVFLTDTNDSFPAEAGVYACFKLGSGDLSGISENVLKELECLGWISPQGNT